MRTPSKWYRLVWPEVIALPIALIFAGGAYAFWNIAVLSLAGNVHQRFDSMMIDGTIKAVLLLVVPIWLLLRGADIGVRILSRSYRTDPRRFAPAGLPPAP